jgi:uncharacterized protein YecA (UPF0149 family)
MLNFKGYEIDREKAEILFKYEIVQKDEHFSFSEKLIFDKNLTDFSKAPESVIESALETLHILLGKAHGKIGRNDPCWCGSGKKYKKCHYPN